MDDTADDAPEWYRILQLRQHVVRIATLASRASFARWRNDMFRKTQTVVDEDLFLLVVHLMAYPTASNDEIRRFIFKEGRNRSLYSRVVAENLVREELFWTTPFPTGVKSIPIDELVDIDEASLTIEPFKRAYGRSYLGTRVSQQGPFDVTKTNWNCMCAITGRSDQIVHSEITQENGCTLTYIRFMRSLIARLKHNWPGVRFTILLDNVRFPCSDTVALMVHMAGYRIVPRPKYRPNHGPIEYIFCQLEAVLARRMYNVQNHADLYTNVREVLSNIHGIRNTFTHCGYPA